MPDLLSSAQRVVIHRYWLNRRDLARRLVGFSRAQVASLRRDDDVSEFIGHPFRCDNNSANRLEVHIVNVVGEQWFVELLYMLAALGVTGDRIDVLDDPRFSVRTTLDAELGGTLVGEAFQSVTVCPVSQVAKAAEDLARRAQALSRLRAALDPVLQGRFARLAAVSVDPIALYDAVAADPRLGPRLAGANDLEVDADTFLFDLRRRALFTHGVLRAGSDAHLLVDIRWGGHGDLAHAVTEFSLASGSVPTGRAQQFGSCASLKADRPVNALVAPIGDEILSLSGPAVPLRNEVPASLQIAGVRHGHVDTLLAEHDVGVERLLALGIEAVDMEAYHVARAAQGRPVRLVHRVSDVPVVAGQEATRQRSESYRREMWPAILGAVLALGLSEAEGEIA